MADRQVHHGTTVSVAKTELVYPKTLSPPKILTLSNLDRQCPILMYLVLFYKPCHAYSDLSLNSVFSSLKSGLEETLSIWYPAAGRLRLNPDDGKLNLWCNNEGAILVEAETPVRISELGDLSQYNDFLEKLVHKPIFNGNFSEMPLVVAQVTKFGCGGYSVSIGASHSLFDGPATFEFLRAWASNSVIMKEKNSHALHKPVHERETLSVGYGHAQTARIRAAAIDHLYQLIQQSFSGDTETDGSNYVLRTFHLSGEMIEKLKRTILGEGGGGSFSCSSFDVVTAHLWKVRTKALRVRNERMVCLQFAVDTRNKMAPPLPKGFSGNAYVLTSVALRAGELEEMSHEAVIEKIKQAKSLVNGEYVKAYMAALEGPQGALPPLKELTIVSDWTRTPFHKIDFLPGNAAYATPLFCPIPQVAYFMQNPTDVKGGIDVRIGLHPAVLDAFSHHFLLNLQ